MARVELLVGPRGGRFPYSNCLLVSGAKHRVLVDAGCGGEVLDSLEGRLDAVVYTHLHPDHIRGYRMARAPRVLVSCPEQGYTGLEHLARRFAPPVWDRWLEYASRVFGLDGVPEATGCYEAWEEVRVGGVSLEMIPAYGHLWGHHLVLAGRHLHLSDIDLTGFGPWYGHPESSPDVFHADIQTAVELAGEAEAVTTSHKPDVLDPYHAVSGLEAYARRLEEQAAQVWEWLARQERPVRPRDLVGRRVIYRRYLEGAEDIFAYFEEMMAWKLLNHLTIIGLARKTRHGYVALNR